MASGGKLKAVGGPDPTKRRKVAFSADVAPVSCDANECLKLHVVLAGQDLQGDDGDDDDFTFDPEFSERIFGEDGKIYGYNGLKIDLWMHAATFNTYVQIRYDSKSAGGRKPITDVLAKLKEAFGDGLTEDRGSFLQSLLNYSHAFQQILQEHGEVVCSWRAPVVNEQSTGAGSDSEVSEELKQIVRMDFSNPTVRAWHANLNPLVLLFIEGGQAIEPDDSWEVFLALDGEGPSMKVVGFCDVYRWYHYPDSTRLRISRILVLPPYQGSGFGLRLLEAVNSKASESACYDVTMEEPSVALQKLRDTMDVLRLLSLPSLTETIKDALSKLQCEKVLELSGKKALVSCGPLIDFNGNKIDGPSQSSRQGLKEKSLLAPPVHLVEEVRKKFKISKMQFKRCWEQLLFLFLDPDDKDLQDVFRAALVQRLNLEIFEKEYGNKSIGKKVVDTDNKYDSSKTFIMIRSRKIDSAAGNGCSIAPLESNVADEASALRPAPQEKAKVLAEETTEREEELLAVAQSVARHCRTLGLTVPLLKVWKQDFQEVENRAEID